MQQFLVLSSESSNLSTPTMSIERKVIYDDVAHTAILIGGQKLINVHTSNQCFGKNCCIHNPSDHHMRGWLMVYAFTKGSMQRICPDHNTLHPDPDDPFAGEINPCCGCCNPKPEPIEVELIDIE